MLIGPEHSLADEQARMNQSTRGQWDWYASHRAQIERLIVPRRKGERICVLGAGNCNDLDLKWLSEAYAEVHLVDIDPLALQRACARQGIAPGECIKLHAPVDLTGISSLTSGWRGRNVSEQELIDAARACKESVSSLNERFDLMLSPCVLSQLLCGVRDLLAKRHPQWPLLKTALRSRHLREIGQLTSAGGRAVLVIDLSSSGAMPGLERARDDELPGVMRNCVEMKKCFSALEPGELLSVFKAEAGIGLTLENRGMSAPWLWHLGFGKAFLVYAMTLEKKDPARR
jgi:hypothetical protein